METAMMELIKFFDLSPKDNEMTSYDGKLKLDELLEAEKKQIVDAWQEGYYAECENEENNADGYYTATYQSK